MSKIETLHDLLIEELKDLYDAETQLLKALPKMAKAASSDGLKNGFETHLKETEGHVSRLERIAELLEFSPKGKKCVAMKGLIGEGAETIDLDATPAIKDAALIIAAQKVEHYEIAGYGSLRVFAGLLGYDKVREILSETLEEEAATDKHLSELAHDINLEAEAAEGSRN